jgi:hypothetical protein
VHAVNERVIRVHVQRTPSVKYSTMYGSDELQIIFDRLLTLHLTQTLFCLYEIVLANR